MKSLAGEIKVLRQIWDKALGYFQHAGRKAEDRSAYREAVACHEQALDALRHLPESRERREQAIDLRFRLRHALTPLGEFERGFAYLCEAETLAQALGDQHRLGWVSAFMALYFSLIGDQDRAIVCGQRALTMATAHDDTALHDEASTYLAQAYHALGDYRRALDLLRTSVAALESDRFRQRLDTGSQAPVFSRTVMALCLAEVGAFPEGTACAAEGLQIAEAANHSFSLILAYWGVGLLALSKGDVYTATPVLERASALCQAVKLPALFPIFVSALSYAYALAGRSTEALAMLQQARTAVTSLELTTSVFHALVSAWLGEVCLLAGRLDDALSFALQARDHSREHRERGQQVRALLLLGAIAARRQAGQVEPAEADYGQALSLAEELGMRPLLAHSHLGLGTLYLQAERHEQARSELAAAIELYRAMDMTFWLPQAEAALAQVM